MSEGAWGRFFCCCCQTERDISERTVKKNRVLCIGCKEKSRPMTTTVKTKKPDRLMPGDHDIEIDTSIPTGIWESYRETVTE